MRIVLGLKKEYYTLNSTPQNLNFIDYNESLLRDLILQP